MQALRSACQTPAPPAAPRPADQLAAAVLLIADATGDDLPVLFVQRSDRVSTHRGQIAFPGGRLEEGEDPVTAALREAAEEVALPPAAAEVLGTMPAFSTAVSNRWLTPVVCLSHQPWQVVSDGYEVADWFWVPLPELLEAPHTVRVLEHEGHSRSVHFYEAAGRTIWGVTGAIVHELRDRMNAVAR